jgi:diguanylate cyclase (GGDEF)-like protein
VEPSRSREPQIIANWQRARLGVVVPLCVVVMVAIVCIVVAALTSARRANEVAVGQERRLLTRSIVNHAEWSLRRLHTVVESVAVIRNSDITGEPTAVQRRLSLSLQGLLDHDAVLVIDAADRPVFVQLGRSDITPEQGQVILSEIMPIVGLLRGHRSALPDGTIRLFGEDISSKASDGAGSVFLKVVLDRVAVVTALALADGDGKSSAPETPSALIFSIRSIEHSILDSIGERLQLANLRMVEQGPIPATDHEFDLSDAGQRLIARSAWTPKRPGAEILKSVVPFIAIALGGFALLAGLVLRYMRHTAAAIAAGENRLRYLALYDPLCGLPNRNFFSERLEALIADVQRGGPPAAVFYLDLDHFKDVNDTLGHPVGDELIRNVSLRLARITRGDDLVARLGGDEFAVITSAASDQAGLQKVAERIIATLCAPYSAGGHTIVIGASIGIALVDGRAGNDAADVMRYADMALYRAKNEGRNRACIYDAVMDANLSHRKLIEQDLREAIERKRIDVLYQPILNAGGDMVVGVEALARWRHSTRGLIEPSEFIPIAEHSGLIIALGAHVLRRACIDGQAWPEVTVAVNVSPLQFRQIDFVDRVERILAETRFEPSRLELEITESTLLGNVESAEAAMRRLKALGVHLALDDFGTGYSSLLYLRRFPFDKLKIDRSFVLSIDKAADAAAIVHAVVGLGRGLGMKVTAEGVETAEQHLFLRAAGVHYMQGFRFSAPLPASEIAPRIAMRGPPRGIESDAAALAG